MPPAATIERGFDVDAAHAHLRRRDRKLAAWMRKIPVPDTDFARRFDPVDALARSILYQQLSGKAAATITGRVEALMPGRGKISARGLLAVDDPALRGAGVSRQKIAALRDLALKGSDGTVPGMAKLSRMHNDDIIEHLTAVRGIGRWTVEMMLMFRLGRPDVLPAHDLGIQKGMQIVDQLDALPKPKVLAELGARWAPYRTLASMYLWRIVEFEHPSPPTRRSQD